MKLPLYEAKIEEDMDGICCVSLVEMPATESDFVMFKKKEKQVYSIADDSKHILTGAIMIADTPIYRQDASGYEYYMQYSKETIRQMAEKMLRDNKHNVFDIQHDGNYINDEISLVELYIVDKEKGIAPNFIDIPDGSLVGSYKVHNEELWEKCKDGTLNGFSLEGYFTVEKPDEKEDTIEDLLEKIYQKCKNKLNKN